MIHKTNEAEFDQGLNCVLSDLTEDRYGDIVGDPAHPMLGWDIANFVKNPIALFGHQSSFPIGVWRDVHVTDGALRGRLHMAPKGSSPRIDELKALLAAGVLKGISVGFSPTEAKPRDNGGMQFLRQELVEASLVSVPANPSALLTAKALGVSKATIAMVFKQSDEQDFMEECISNLEDQGVDDAEAVCAIMWEESAATAAVRARTIAVLNKVDARLAREYEASAAGQAKRHTEETIANFTRTQQRLVPHDPPPYVPNGQYVTWRGQKIDLRMTWRGKKI